MMKITIEIEADEIVEILNTLEATRTFKKLARKDQDMFLNILRSMSVEDQKRTGKKETQ